MRVRALSARTCPIATGWSRRYCRWKRWSLPNYGKTQKQFPFLQDKEASSVDRKSDSEEESLIVDDVQEVCFCFSSSVLGVGVGSEKLHRGRCAGGWNLFSLFFCFHRNTKHGLLCGRKAPQRETIGQKILPSICSSGFFYIVWLLHFQGSSNNHPCIRIAEDKGDEQSEVIEKTHHIFQPYKPQKVQSCNLCLERIRRSNQLWYPDICARRWIFVHLSRCTVLGFKSFQKRRPRELQDGAARRRQVLWASGTLSSSEIALNYNNIYHFEKV